MRLARSRRPAISLSVFTSFHVVVTLMVLRCPYSAVLVKTHRNGRNYSATAAAKVSTTAMFCSNSGGKLCRSCKYTGLL